MIVPTLLALLAASPPPVDFDTEVLPVLTRAGCNAGACHGAAAGRGGFKLSLFGGDPAADYRAIAHELEGRRLNLARPERSLLLLKPTWQLDHEGGERFAADSPEAELLSRWIAAGAPRPDLREKQRRLVRLEVVPSTTSVAALPATVDLRVVAHFSDGTTRDARDLAVYTPADPAATLVNSQGRITIERPGRHTVVVRFLTDVVAVQITAPHANESVALSSESSANWIDDEINASLIALRLPPSPPATDAELLRRVTLDLTGRLPEVEQVRAYLADESPGKYEAEVNRLLRLPEFTKYWTYKIGQQLRIGDSDNLAIVARPLYPWMEEQIGVGRPIHEWTREMLLASGDTTSGPAAFHRLAADARGQAEHVAETLLGIRLRCANCHNHPLDRWTQDDYHGLAAVFAKLDRGAFVRVLPGGDVTHPATGEPARPRIPGGPFLDGESRAAADHRPALADWILSQNNPYFARAWVNRLWAALFGRGLVEPTDDLRATNPATHPELLDRLAQDFVANQFNLRHTLRLMALSAAYRRSSRATADNQHDDRFYSHALRRPIPAELLVKAVCQITGVEAEAIAPADKIDVAASDPRRRKRPAPMRKREPPPPLPDPLGLAECTGQRPPINFLQRRMAPEPLASPHELRGQLEWITGDALNARLAHSKGELAKIAASRVSSRALVEEYYLRILSRPPGEAELAFWSDELRGGGRGKKCEDLAWALLSCDEFLTNH